MKATRQTAILELIAHKSIVTQEDLADNLREIGFHVTQATVSRDIKELRLVKVAEADGAYRYASGEKQDQEHSARLIRLMSETILSMSSAYNQIVIKTMSASANIACEALDSLQWPEVLGTIAGENTILIIVRSMEEVPVVKERLHALIKR